MMAFAIYLSQVWAASDGVVPKEPHPNNFNFQKELEAHFGKTISHKFNGSELIIDGWFNLNSCRAPKLKALIEAYVKEEELCKKNPKRTFSTGSIQAHLNADFEIINSKGDKDNFLEKLSHVASITPSGASLKKRTPNKDDKNQ
jgi:hypothetical protein